MNDVKPGGRYSFPIGGMVGAVVQSVEMVADESAGFAGGDIVRITFADGSRFQVEASYFMDISLSGPEK